jgi:hypothetical protein
VALNRQLALRKWQVVDWTIQARNFRNIEEQIFDRSNANFGEHLLTI